MIDINLSRLGITQLSDMQEKMKRTVLDGTSDVVLLSPTGTGKTIAYLYPLLQCINLQSDEVQVVVIVPSRELAMQSAEVLRSMGTPVRGLACYGGRPTMDERRHLLSVRPHIVFATPGRLNDHLQKGYINTYSVSTVVIDEFDKCLELGFHDEMRAALKALPETVRKILLSATDIDTIPKFVNADNVSRLSFLADNEEESRISYQVVHSPQKDKLNTLYDLLCALGDVQTIVFLNYREAVERVVNFLRKQGVVCEGYHGGLEQDRREKALYKFVNGSSHVLVCTDLGSRGLDITETDCIVHYHLPLNEDLFIHRNGRATRWKSKGRSFLILNEDEVLPEYIDDKNVSEFYIPKNLSPVPQPKMTTLYIGKGKKEKLSKVDVLGFLCKIGGLDGKHIGRIDVREHCCYCAIVRTEMSALLPRLKGQKIKGLKTIYVEAKF